MARTLAPGRPGFDPERRGSETVQTLRRSRNPEFGKEPEPPLEGLGTEAAAETG